VTYRTVSATTTFFDEPVKGSRFAAHVAPASSDADALAAVADARAAWPDASHHAWAFKLLDGRQRAFDAGEPRESAGRPILLMIEGHALLDVVVVVARWYGGTKLGVGGLMRAYGGCAGRALDRAPVVARIRRIIASLTHEYADTAAIQAALATEEAELLDARYDDRVTLTLAVPEPRLQALDAALRDRTSGRVRLDVPTNAR
jgi:uncharacterized YigZ family protein